MENLYTSKKKSAPMNKFGFIFTLLVTLSTFPDSHLIAQGNTVVKMRASVTVIPGATVTETRPVSINLEKRSSSAGQISFNGSKFVQIDLEVTKSAELNNEFGDEVLMNFEVEQGVEDGKQYVDITPSFSEKIMKTNKGSYSGNLTVMVSYH